MSSRTVSVVTRSPWNCGGSQSSDEPGVYRFQPFRIRERHEFESRGIDVSHWPYNFIVQHGQLYDHIIPVVPGDYETHHNEHTRLGILYGYLQPYNRNLCGFVMTRAARKRGYRSPDSSYNREAMKRGKLPSELGSKPFPTMYRVVGIYQKKVNGVYVERLTLYKNLGRQAAEQHAADLNAHSPHRNVATFVVEYGNGYC